MSTRSKIDEAMPWHDLVRAVPSVAVDKAQQLVEHYEK
jgi:hypothetical protein